MRALGCVLFVNWMLLGCSSGKEGGSGPEPVDVDVSSRAETSLSSVSDSGIHGADTLDTHQSSEIVSAPVDEPGPHQVGYRTIPLEYAPEEGRTRVLDLHLWYPTSQMEGDHPIYEKVFPDAVSLVGAELLNEGPEGGFPLLIFSHGHRGFGGNASFLMRHFASHGWVAVAPDHTNNTLTDSSDSRETSMYYLRSLDMRAVLGFLDTSEGTDPLQGKLAVQRVVMAGHSFGVDTGWASAGASFDMERINERCAANPDEDGCHAGGLKIFEDGLRDERVISMIAMAGSIDENFYGSGGHETVAIPFFSMSGTEDPVGADLQYERCKDMDFRWIEFMGGCHQTFGFGGCATLDDELGFNLVSAYALAFARHTLMFDESPEVLGYVDGGTIASEKIIFHGAP